MAVENPQTTRPDLEEVEVELCRLPDVVAARIVADEVGRPVEVHVLAHTGKHPKQVVRDIQSVALASFGLDLDRRIVSVVQLGRDDDETTTALGTAAALRPRIISVDSQLSGVRSTVRVTLGLGNEEATGFAEGSTAAATRTRLIANATIDALQQLGAVDALDIDDAKTMDLGGEEVVIVTVVNVEPPHELRLSGSAIVRQHRDDSTVRAVLDAINRRLPHLAPEREDS